MEENLKIEYVDVDLLVPSIHNARTHSPEQVEKIIDSINDHGYVMPLIINSSKTIVCGHGRRMAALKLGIKRLPCVINSALDDEVAMISYMKADNRIALDAGWDYDVLKAEFEFLEAEGWAATKTGFTQEEIDEILNPEVEAEPEEEQGVPELTVDPVSKPGDIWLLGKHRLMCGSSVNMDDVAKLMDSNVANMVFTDPPYNMDFTGGIHADGSKSFNAKHGAIKNDKMSAEEAMSFFDGINMMIKTYCSGAFYISFYRLGINDYWQSLTRCGLEVRALIIWDKGNHTLSNSVYMSMYEPIFYGWVKDHKFYGGNNGRDIWAISRTQKNDLHPTMKPIELVTKAIQEGSKPGELVLDLFGGSGSTLIACEKTKRKCVMMELDPKYCDVIIKRWQNESKQDATLEGTNQTFNSLLT